MWLVPLRRRRLNAAPAVERVELLNFWTGTADPSMYGFGGNVALAANAGGGPDGTDCLRFTDAGWGADHMRFTRTPQGYARNSGTGVITGRVKRNAGASWFALSFYRSDTDTTTTSWFNAATGALGTIDASHTLETESLGGGWIAFSWLFPDTMRNINTMPILSFKACSADNVQTGAGDGTLNWDVQVAWNPHLTEAPATFQWQGAELNTTDVVLIADGDGMQEVDSSDPGTNAMAFQLAGLLSDLHAQTIMFAVNGLSAQHLDEDVASQANAMKTTEGRAVLLLWVQWSANALTWMEEYAAAVDPEIPIVAFTFTTFAGISGPDDAQRQLDNAAMLASASFDRVVDIAALAQFSNPADATYFNAGVTLSDAGNLLVAQTAEADVRAVLA